MQTVATVGGLSLTSAMQFGFPVPTSFKGFPRRVSSHRNVTANRLVLLHHENGLRCWYGEIIAPVVSLSPPPPRGKNVPMTSCSLSRVDLIESLGLDGPAEPLGSLDLSPGRAKSHCARVSFLQHLEGRAS